MAIASGSYTVGGGGDYNTWADAIADIAAVLTGDLTLTQIGDTVENVGIATGSIPAVNMAGYTLTITCSDPHGGDPTSGFKSRVTFSTASTVAFGLYLSNTGMLEVKNIHFSVEGSPTISFSISAIDTVVRFHDNMSLGSGGGSAGTNFFFNSDSGEFSVWNNIAYLGTIGYSCNNYTATPTQFKLENNDSHGCDDNYTINENGIAAKNNAGWDSLFAETDFSGAALSASDGDNNASADGSADDSNWNTGNDNLIGITAGDEFDSLTPDNSLYLKVNATGDLGGGGVAPSIVQNVAGIRGNDRPHSGPLYSIGADELAAGGGGSTGGCGGASGLSGAIVAAVHAGYR